MWEGNLHPSPIKSSLLRVYKYLSRNSLKCTTAIPAEVIPSAYSSRVTIYFWKIVTCFLQASDFTLSGTFSFHSEANLHINPFLEALANEINLQLICFTYINLEAFPEQLHVDQVLHPFLDLRQRINSSNGITNS